MREPGCVERCPACPHRDLTAEISLSRKEEWVRHELKNQRIEKIITLGPRWGYRGKALLHARLRDNRWQLGLIKMHGREEEFIPIPNCPLHSPQVNEVFSFVEGVTPAHLPLAFVLVSGQACTLVIKSKRRAEWAEEIRSWNWPKEVSVFVNWNPVAGKRAIDSRRTEHLKGAVSFLSDGLVHGPTSFRQQIPAMAKLALVMAEDFLAAAKLGVAVDFYCGLGASLQRWEARGWECVGVELSGESIKSAKINSPMAVLFRGRTEDRLPQINEFLKGRPFVAYTNPPRSGHSEEMLHWFLTAKPARIAYLSCHPRSLAGDMERLEKSYLVKKVQPLDFFPQSSQVENLVLLELRA